MVSFACVVSGPVKENKIIFWNCFITSQLTNSLHYCKKTPDVDPLIVKEIAQIN